MSNNSTLAGAYVKYTYNYMTQDQRRTLRPQAWEYGMIAETFFKNNQLYLILINQNSAIEEVAYSELDIRILKTGTGKVLDQHNANDHPWLYATNRYAMPPTDFPIPATTGVVPGIQAGQPVDPAGTAPNQTFGETLHQQFNRLLGERRNHLHNMAQAAIRNNIMQHEIAEATVPNPVPTEFTIEDMPHPTTFTAPNAVEMAMGTTIGHN